MLMLTLSLSFLPAPGLFTDYCLSFGKCFIVKRLKAASG